MKENKQYPFGLTILDRVKKCKIFYNNETNKLTTSVWTSYRRMSYDYSFVLLESDGIKFIFNVTKLDTGDSFDVDIPVYDAQSMSRVRKDYNRESGILDFASLLHGSLYQDRHGLKEVFIQKFGSEGGIVEKRDEIWAGMEERVKKHAKTKHYKKCTGLTLEVYS